MVAYLYYTVYIQPQKLLDLIVSSVREYSFSNDSLCCMFAVFLAELDPSNYMTFYRRATVYLAMGKSKSALPDLDVVLSLKPDFNAVCCPFACLFFGCMVQENFYSLLIEVATRPGCVHYVRKRLTCR